MQLISYLCVCSGSNPCTYGVKLRKYGFHTSSPRKAAAIRGVAGSTPVSLARDKKIVENLRERKAIQRPVDLGIKESGATRDLLSAKTFEDIIELSGGLYSPPDQCRMR